MLIQANIKIILWRERERERERETSVLKFYLNIFELNSLILRQIHMNTYEIFTQFFENIEYRTHILAIVC